MSGRVFALALLLSGCVAQAQPTTPHFDLPEVAYRSVDVEGAHVFYREAGPTDAPTLLLLHGFPSSSHQFRRLIDGLGSELHVVAPDYPGFGQSEPIGAFEPSFDRLADVIEAFCEELGLTQFYVYVFDFGAPVGFRIALRQPEWIAGMIVQNGNAYEDGLGELTRALIHPAPDVTPEQALALRRQMLTLEATRGQYLAGAGRPELVAPDGWTLDQHGLDRPGHDTFMLALMDDYASNVASYPAWQAWLRAAQPPLLVLWGQNDPIFVARGALAYQRDVPDAEVHLLDGGHFALEEHAPQIVQLIRAFVGAHAR